LPRYHFSETRIMIRPGVIAFQRALTVDFLDAGGSADQG
jgi:hypothetical protein